MMRRLFLLAALILLPLGAPGAQALVAIIAASTTSYTGPFDIVGSPTAFYSLRAGSSAIAAAGTQSIVDLRRPSDNATCPATIAATGGALDLTVKTSCNSSTQTVTAWLNNASSVTATIATTVLTVSACSACNLATGLPITGAGVTAGTVIVSLGTGTGGIGTYNINISQTESVAEAMTAPAYAFVSKWYDQSGNVKDASQATAAQQPQLILSGGANNLPYLAFVRASNQGLATGAITAPSQPWSVSAVAERTGTFTNFAMIVAIPSQSVGLRFDSSANTADIASTTVLTKAATDSAWHAFQGLFSGASSVISVDGAETSGNAGTVATSTPIMLGLATFNNNPLDGNIAEAGVWPVGFTSGNRSAMQANQKAYWGTP